MVMFIKWTPLALRSLREVYDFYLPHTGRKKAFEIVDEIRKHVLYLEKFPEMGTIEIIDGIVTNYRYLVLNKCKIYYTIEVNYVRIAFVWDTRRDPEILKQFL